MPTPHQTRIPNPFFNFAILSNRIILPGCCLHMPSQSIYYGAFSIRQISRLHGYECTRT